MEKKIFEKNFFGSEVPGPKFFKVLFGAILGHSGTVQWVLMCKYSHLWGTHRSTFGFLMVPDHVGSKKISFGDKKIFLRKMHFFGAKMAQNAHKMAQNGTSRGLQRVNFGFLRPPDPLGTLKNQFGAKKTFCQKKAFFWLFLERVLAILYAKWCLHNMAPPSVPKSSALLKP